MTHGRPGRVPRWALAALAVAGALAAGVGGAWAVAAVLSPVTTQVVPGPVLTSTARVTVTAHATRTRTRTVTVAGPTVYQAGPTVYRTAPGGTVTVPGPTVTVPVPGPTVTVTALPP